MNRYCFILIFFFSTFFSEPILVTYEKMRLEQASDDISLNIQHFIAGSKHKGEEKLDKLYKFDVIYGEMLENLDDNNDKYFTHLDNIYYIGKYAISDTYSMKKFNDNSRVTVYSLFNSVYKIEEYDEVDRHYLLKTTDFKRDGKFPNGEPAYRIGNNILGWGKLPMRGAGISKKTINYTLLSGTMISGGLTAYYSYRYSNSVQPHVRYAYQGRRNLLLWSDLFFAAVYGWYLLNNYDDGIW